MANDATLAAERWLRSARSLSDALAGGRHDQVRALLAERDQILATLRRYADGEGLPGETRRLLREAAAVDAENIRTLEQTLRGLADELHLIRDGREACRQYARAVAIDPDHVLNQRG